jgi:hypothetical protein
MEKKELQPKVVAPVERQTTGSIINAQPNGGIGASVPCMPCLPMFAADDAE